MKLTPIIALATALAINGCASTNHTLKKPLDSCRDMITLSSTIQDRVIKELDTTDDWTDYISSMNNKYLDCTEKYKNTPIKIEKMWLYSDAREKYILTILSNKERLISLGIFSDNQEIDNFILSLYNKY